MNRYISPKKRHHDPFGWCRLQCGDCSRERNQRAQRKMFECGNRQKTRNHFESFWRLCPWPTKATHLELTSAPNPSGETERIRPGEPRCAVRIASPERRAGARQIHNPLGRRNAPIHAPGFRGLRRRAEEPRGEGASASLVLGVPRALLCSAPPARGIRPGRARSWALGGPGWLWAWGTGLDVTTWGPHPPLAFQDQRLVPEEFRLIFA